MSTIAAPLIALAKELNTSAQNNGFELTLAHAVKRSVDFSIDYAVTEAAFVELRRRVTDDEVVRMMDRIQRTVFHAHLTLSEILFDGHTGRKLHTMHPLNVFFAQYGLQLQNLCLVYTFLGNDAAMRTTMPMVFIEGVHPSIVAVMHLTSEFDRSVRKKFMLLHGERARCMNPSFLRLGVRPGMLYSSRPANDTGDDDADEACPTATPPPQDPATATVPPIVQTPAAVHQPKPAKSKQRQRQNGNKKKPTNENK